MTNYGDTLSSEEKLEQVFRFMNQLKAAGMDRLTESGYVQWDGIGLRLDNNGQQIKSSNNTEVIAIWFVPTLANDPANQTPQGYIAGTIDSDTVVLNLRANDGLGNTAQAYVFADDASDSSGFRSDIDNDDTSAATWVTHKTVNGQTWGILELLNTSLRVASFTADPTGVQNGDIWYNTTSTQLKARVNGSTVVLA